MNEDVVVKFWHALAALILIPVTFFVGAFVEARLVDECIRESTVTLFTGAATPACDVANWMGWWSS